MTSGPRQLQGGAALHQFVLREASRGEHAATVAPLPDLDSGIHLSGRPLDRRAGHAPIKLVRVDEMTRIAGGRLETLDLPGDDRVPTVVLLHEGLGSVRLWRDFPVGARPPPPAAPSSRSPASGMASRTPRGRAPRRSCTRRRWTCCRSSSLGRHRGACPRRPRRRRLDRADPRGRHPVREGRRHGPARVRRGHVRRGDPPGEARLRDERASGSGWRATIRTPTRRSTAGTMSGWTRTSCSGPRGVPGGHHVPAAGHPG